MLYILFFVIAVLTTGIGAVVGMGGGVIMKPLLDAVSGLDAVAVTAISSCAVFAMAAVNVARHIRQKSPLPYAVAVPLSLASLLGGALGQLALEALAQTLRLGGCLGLVQNGLLCLLLLGTLVYTLDRDHLRSYAAKGLLPPLAAGLALGFLSAFLGIGGGPFNVAVLLLLFSLEIKEAALCSMLMILCAQSTKLLKAMASGSFPAVEPELLLAAVAGAVLGGWAGVWLHKKLSTRTTERCYLYVQAVVLGLTLWNIVHAS